MPHSLLLRRLSFTILSAVDSFTSLLLSCESHMPSSPHSPRSPRPIRRKPPLISTPTSPTSVNPHHSPIIPSIDDQPPLRRSRSRHHPTSTRTSPRNFNCDNLVHPRLSRREFLPPSVRQQSHRHTSPRQQQKRLRTPSRHHNHHRKQQRLAFVDSPANNLPSIQALNAWRRNRDTVNRVPAHHLHKNLQHPPVSPIALPRPVRLPPRGTLTSFLTTDDTDIFRLNQIETTSAKEQLLEQGIRPSRRVRFAQNVQLVC